jgi:adenylate kinase
MGLNVIMMGPPGAGKGTQAERFARQRGVPKISTGDILREAARAGTPVGLRVKARMDGGELVDDATMIEIVRERLLRSDAARGFVLDGFPRTVVQAEALDRFMTERRNGSLIVVDVQVPQQELVRRLALRRVCVKCAQNADPSSASDACARCGGELEQRLDDEQAKVLRRFDVYQEATKPVLEYYRGRPTFRVVNGAQPPDRVAHELDAMIDDAAGVEAGQL